MNYKKDLTEKINKLINGSTTVPEFEKEYSSYYLNEVPDDALNETEDIFFGLVQEKLDWIAELPTEEEKKNGYLNYEEYTSWLKENTQDFFSNEKQWYEKYSFNFKQLKTTQ